MDRIHHGDLVVEGMLVMFICSPNESFPLLISLGVQFLTFIYRLGLWQQKFVKIMAYVCAVTYIAVLLTLFTHCTPIERNWRVKPYAGGKFSYKELCCCLYGIEG
jgi:hypothetical protein